MSYVLQGLLARPETLARADLPGARIVPLAQNVALLPLKSIVRRPLRLPECPLTEDRPVPLPDTFVTLLETLSDRARVVYVEARFWAGAGIQACVIAEQGELDPPQVGPSVINGALDFLGVEPAGAADAFAAVDLGRYRHTEDW